MAQNRTCNLSVTGRPSSPLRHVFKVPPDMMMMMMMMLSNDVQSFTARDIRQQTCTTSTKYVSLTMFAGSIGRH
jgi:hypothetical protein